MKLRLFFSMFFLGLFLLLVPAGSLWAQIPGKYEVISPKSLPKLGSLDQVTVKEVLAFSCPHCFTLNEQLAIIENKFGKRLKVISVPIGWKGVDPGRLMYIARKKGKEKAVIDMIFDFYHIKGLGASIYTRDKLQFIAKMNGLTDEFKTMMDSPEIVKQMNDGMQYIKDLNINSTPTLIIEDSLKINGNPSNFILIVNSLLKKPIK